MNELAPESSGEVVDHRAIVNGVEIDNTATLAD
jgi:hypothetical protein